MLPSPVSTSRRLSSRTAANCVALVRCAAISGAEQPERLLVGRVERLRLRRVELEHAHGCRRRGAGAARRSCDTAPTRRHASASTRGSLVASSQRSSWPVSMQSPDRLSAASIRRPRNCGGRARGSLVDQLVAVGHLDDRRGGVGDLPAHVPQPAASPRPGRAASWRSRSGSRRPSEGDRLPHVCSFLPYRTLWRTIKWRAVLASGCAPRCGLDALHVAREHLHAPAVAEHHVEHHAAEALGESARLPLGRVHLVRRSGRRTRGTRRAIGPSSSRVESSSCSVRKSPAVTPAVGEMTTAAMSSALHARLARGACDQILGGGVGAELVEQLGEPLASEHAVRGARLDQAVGEQARHGAGHQRHRGLAQAGALAHSDRAATSWPSPGRAGADRPLSAPGVRRWRR